MKHFLLIGVSATLLLITNQFDFFKIPNFETCNAAKLASLNTDKGCNLQEETGGGRMSATVFKNQKYCRVELKDFEFEVGYTILSAKVYFTGANFKTVEQGYISSSSLKPIADQMARCTAGSVVMFDDVKVIGPDKEKRTIPGASYVLY